MDRDGLGARRGERDPVVEDLTSLYARDATHPVDVGRIVAGGVARARRVRRRQRVRFGIAAGAAVGMLAAGGWLALGESQRMVETVLPATPTGGTTPPTDPRTSPAGSITTSVSASATTATSASATSATSASTAARTSASTVAKTSATAARTTPRSASPGTVAAPGSPAPAPTRTTSSSADLVDLATASLSVDPAGGPEATVYVGRLSAVLGRLSNRVTFAVPSAYQAAHPDRCVVTVVFENVVGTTAVVYATGLENAGWTAAEAPPSQRVATDGGRVHQQLVVPPAGPGTPATWTAAALLDVDGRTYSTAGYALSRLQGGSGWRLGSTDVGCGA